MITFFFDDLRNLTKIRKKFPSSHADNRDSGLCVNITRCLDLERLTTMNEKHFRQCSLSNKYFFSGVIY